MIKILFKIILILLICITSLYVGVFEVYFKVVPISRETKYQKEEYPVILWWTPFTGVQNIVRKCNYGSCLFTEDRDYFKLEKDVKVFLFYGSDFKIEDLPLPRKPHHWWALLHEESPKNQPLFDHQPALSLFNLTSTFKRDSGMPLTLQYLQGIDTLISKSYFVPTSMKNWLLKQENLSPIIYIQSDCNPPSQRDKYVSEIMKYLPIDSYGLCLNNIELPNHLKGIESMNHPEILRLIAKYKFSIAFENAACDDYITEKLWRPLEVGTVPIYWGSPSVHDWLPNNNSIIHVRNFKTPQDLVAHLLNCLTNDTLYEQHLEHKLHSTIRNEKLAHYLKQRWWGINEDQDTKGTFVEAFECFVCNTVINRYDTSEPGSFIANKAHYGCPIPETVLPTKEEEGFWVEQWYKGEAEAEVLLDLIEESHNTFSINTFYERVITLLHSRKYFQKFAQEEL